MQGLADWSSSLGHAGADPGFLERGFKFTKGVMFLVPVQRICKKKHSMLKHYGPP